MTRDDLAGMVRGNEYTTSTEAAEAVAPRRSAMQLLIIAAFEKYGAMTDEQLEQLPIFRLNFGQTTISKSRTELFQQGVLEAVGERINSRGRNMVLWDLRRHQYADKLF